MRRWQKMMIAGALLCVCAPQTAYADGVQLAASPVQEAAALKTQGGKAQGNQAIQPIPLADTLSTAAAAGAQSQAPGSLGSGTELGTAPGAQVGQAPASADSATASLLYGPGIGGQKSAQVFQSGSTLSQPRQQLLQYAQQFLGNPYVYGGTSLTEGADCSGFTQSIFAHFNLTTGRSSRDQYDKVQKITRQELLPGDLVFYSSGSDAASINHVAIYYGNGQIIHAANEASGITTSPMDYRAPFGYGRLIQN